MNPTNSKKVMKISINGDISYFDYHLDGRKNTFFNVPYGGYSLTAGDYIGLKLAIYQPFKPIRGQENKYGSKIASYLKDPYYVLPYPTYGDVVLIDDAGDMNQGKLDKINSIIELKDLQQQPIWKFTFQFTIMFFTFFIRLCEFPISFFTFRS